MNRMPMCPLMPAALPCDRCSHRRASKATCECFMLREKGFNTQSLMHRHTGKVLNLRATELIYFYRCSFDYFDSFKKKTKRFCVKIYSL